MDLKNEGAFFVLFREKKGGNDAIQWACFACFARGAPIMGARYGFIKVDIYLVIKASDNGSSE